MGDRAGHANQRPRSRGITTLEVVLAVGAGTLLILGFLGFIFGQQRTFVAALSQGRSPQAGAAIVDALRVLMQQAASTSTVATVTTVAGSGGYGVVNGQGSAASFAQPLGVAVDPVTGNIWVGDTALRVVTPGGLVSTLTGGASGYADGAAGAARFHGIQAIVPDGAGNLIVADNDETSNGNYAIRSVTNTGTVTTIAGAPPPTGVNAATDGAGTAARFGRGLNLVRDPGTGNYFIADWDHGLRGMTAGPGFNVSTIKAAFNFHGVTEDGAGNVYVADTGNKIWKFAGGAGPGVVIAGTGGSGEVDGPALSAQFNDPWYLCADAQGDLFVSDYGGATIREVTAGGTVVTIAGVPNVSGEKDGPGNQAKFTWPAGIARDGQGNLYVADSANCYLRKLTLSSLRGVGFLAASSGSLTFRAASGATASVGYDPVARNLMINAGAGSSSLVPDTAGLVVNGGTPLAPLFAASGQATTSAVGVFSFFDSSNPPQQLDVNGSVPAANLSSIARVQVYLAVQDGPRSAVNYLRSSISPR